MTTLTIPDMDDDLAQRLRARAAVHGRSVEAEARDILEDALGVKQPAAAPDNLYAAIRAIVEPLGGIELEPFPRQAMPEPPNFE
ncbi:MAG: plasmid stabilization protein [Hyphomicrobiales bacterium]|nr:plasmid stabilization protein [Hyphomicrobiales bacterium]